MIKILHIPIYHTTLVMMVDTSIEDWKAFAKLYEDKITEDDNMCVIRDIESSEWDGGTISLDKGDYLFWVRNKNMKGNIAHEIFHAANKILCSRGVTHDDVGEAWAYLIGYITDEFYLMLYGENENVFMLEEETEQKEIADTY